MSIIAGMNDVIEYIKKIEEENNKLKEENKKLKEEYENLEIQFDDYNNLFDEIGEILGDTESGGEVVMVKYFKKEYDKMVEENEKLKEEHEKLKIINELNSLQIEFTGSSEFLDIDEFVIWLKENHDEEKVKKFKSLMDYETDEE